MENQATQSHSGQVARIYVNGIEVGSMPTDQYKSLVKEQKRRVSLHVKGVLNALWVSCNFISRLTITTSSVIVAMFVAMCAFDTGSTIELVKHLRETEPELIANSMQSFFLVVLVVSIPITTVHAALFPARYGYINHIDLEINRKIRELMEVPTEGDMHVQVEKKTSVHVHQ